MWLKHLICLSMVETSHVCHVERSETSLIISGGRTSGKLRFFASLRMTKTTLLVSLTLRLASGESFWRRNRRACLVPVRALLVRVRNLKNPGFIE